MGNMKLSNLEFIRLLPAFMRDDAAIIGFASAMDEIIPIIAERLDTLPTWGHIDQMSDAELDALAWELNILWYDSGASLEVKRRLILDSDKMYKRLGTKWAVENIINTYFGDGYITEWFEYDGAPGHFRVYSTNPSLTDARFLEFMNILGKVKRASSILDGIYITLTGQMNINAGCALHEVGADRFGIGAIPN